MTLIDVTGRIVWGNPLKSQPKTDQTTKQPVLKDGKPVQQWAFGLAVPKADFVANVWPIMSAEAAKVFPNGIPQHFSYKYKDGDTAVDRQGKPYRDRDGYAGHYVITVSQEAFAPPVWRFENGSYVQINDGLKTGDFVTAKLDLIGNKPQNVQHTPGLYINPKGILFAGYGPEIVGAGSDPNELFGAAPVTLAPGASAVPLATTGLPPMPGTQSAPPAPPGMPTVPAMPGNPTPPSAPVVAPPGMPPAAYPPATASPSSPPTMPGMTAPLAPPAPPAPAHDFVQNAMQPLAPPADPNTPVFQGYSPTTGKAVWKLPATGQVWET